MMLVNNLLVMFAFMMFATTSTMNAVTPVPNASEIVLEDNTEETAASQAPANEEETLKYKVPKKEETASAPSALNNKTGS